MDWKPLIGENARRRRSELGLSQEDVAHRVGITVGYYSQVERGRRNMTVDVLARIAEALGVELVALFIRHPS